MVRGAPYLRRELHLDRRDTVVGLDDVCGDLRCRIPQGAESVLVQEKVLLGRKLNHFGDFAEPWKAPSIQAALLQGVFGVLQSVP